MIAEMQGIFCLRKGLGELGLPLNECFTGEVLAIEVQKIKYLALNALRLLVRKGRLQGAEICLATFIENTGLQIQYRALDFYLGDSIRQGCKFVRPILSTPGPQDH